MHLLMQQNCDPNPNYSNPKPNFNKTKDNTIKRSINKTKDKRFRVGGKGLGVIVTRKQRPIALHTIYNKDKRHKELLPIPFTNSKPEPKPNA